MMSLRFFMSLFLVLFLFLADSRHKAHAESQPKVQGLSWGQSLIVSIPGTTLDSVTERYLEKIRPSGILLFRRNIKTPTQTQSLIASLQKIAMRTNKLPYLVLVDQEGGIVTRIQSNPPPPSLLALSHVKDPKVLEEYAQSNGQFLKSLGFNIILAPVADIDDPYRKSFLGHRVVSKDPEQVIDTLTPLVDGYAEAGVLPTLKHFPGHGFLKDSHKETAMKTSNLEQLWDQDLSIYKEFADTNSFFAILTSHIAVPVLDSTKTPTTYSKKIVNQLIRKELNFKGLVISDDVEMGGALTMALHEKIRLAHLAGHDLIIVTSTLNDVDKAVNYLQQKFSKFTEADFVIEQRRQYWRSHFAKSKSENNFRTLQRNLEEKILNLNKLIFDSAWNELTSQGPLGVLPTESWTVVSSDMNLIKGFSKSKQGTASFLLNTKNIATATKYIENYKGPVLFHVSGDKTAKLLLSLGESSWKKILVLNSHYPGALNKLPASILVLNLSTPMPQAGQWTAEHIDISVRTPATVNSKADLKTQVEAPGF